MAGSRDHREEGVRICSNDSLRGESHPRRSPDLAIELGVGYISPGHILYGCAAGERAPPGTVARRRITAESIRRLLPRAENQPVEDVDTEVLRAIGIDFEGVRAVVEETFGSGSLKSAPDRRAAATKTRRPPFTPRRNKR